jgi:hypothetical protein
MAPIHRTMLVGTVLVGTVLVGTVLVGTVSANHNRVALKSPAVSFLHLGEQGTAWLKSFQPRDT